MLAAKLAELLGGELQHVFFNSSGSEANDTVMRMVRHYWIAEGRAEAHGLHQPPQRLSRLDHGGREPRRHGAHASDRRPADPRRRARGAAIQVQRRLQRRRRSVRRARVRRRSRTASSRSGRRTSRRSSAKPVQGAGGVIIPPKGYWKRVEAICKKYGILLVVDEVICGFGRLGSWFGFQHFGVTPDLVPMAKGLSSGYLPISAVGVSQQHRRSAAREGRRVRAWLHLFGPSGRGGGGAEEYRDHRARRSGRAREERRRAVLRRSAEAARGRSAGGRSAFAGADRRRRDRRRRRGRTSASPARKARPGRSCATPASRTG